MQDIGRKLSQMVAIVFMLLICASGAAANGIPWQVGDIVVCYGGGKCNVIRVQGSSALVLDTISSGLLGNNGGVGLNNTLHVLATDDKGGGSSKVVVYSIASIQPFLGTVLNHTVVSTSDGTVNSGDSAAAVAVSGVGHSFVGNSNTTGASIIELDANGTPVPSSTFTFPGAGTCPATKTINSLDLSTAGDAVYVTAGDGVIRKVSLAFVNNVYTLAGASCSNFADFGSNVKLFGIKDIPAGALANVTPNCNGATCPTNEALLVVARGDTDPDAGESEVGSPDPDAINICTNQQLQNSPSVSCGLLIDTSNNAPGLTTPFWEPNGGPSQTLYRVTGVNILDPYLHIQQVTMPGTSGVDEPSFARIGNGRTLDNAVVWTDQGSRQWGIDCASCNSGTAPAPHSYTVGEIVIDSAQHVQQVTTAGLSGDVAPTFNNDSNPPFGVTTPDGLEWQDSGVASCAVCQPTWTSGHAYGVGDKIYDGIPPQHVQTVVVGGTSGINKPAFSHSGGFAFEDNAVTWTDRGNWQPNFAYHVGGMVGDGQQHLQQVIAARPAMITGASETGTLVTIATAAPHGFVVGQQVAVAGVGVAGYNGVFAIAGVTSTAFTYTANSSGLANSGGGTATVSDAGTSGPGPQPSFSHGVGATTPDGLQWTYISGTSPTVVARYPVTGVNTLQSLALDPLVSSCTGTGGTACSTNAPPPRTVTNSGQLVAVPLPPSFWMGDNSSANVYRQNFAGGTPPPFDAGTGGSGVQSLVVYGGESANQPGLASLVVNGTLNSGDVFTTSGQFFQNTITSTLSNSNGSLLPSTSSTSIPISLYSSRVNKTSCFNDPVAGSLFCRGTDPTDSSKAFVWKIDIPLNGSAALDPTLTLNTAFAAPTGIDNGTDVFVDEQFDDTTFNGSDPGTRTVSVHSLHEVQTTFTQTQSKCQFSSPLANTCYKLNRTTLNFTFSCPGLSPTQFDNLKPMLALVMKNAGQAPVFIPISGANGTNGKAAFRLDAPHNLYTFQLNLSTFKPGVYLGTAQDTAGMVQPFTTGNFTLGTTCK